MIMKKCPKENAYLDRKFACVGNPPIFLWGVRQAEYVVNSELLLLFA